MKKTSLLMGLALMMSLGSVAFADDADQTAPHQHHHFRAMKEVFGACAKANNISLPDRNAGEKLSQADRQTMRACVKQVHENMRSCLKNSGIQKPEPGTKPQFTDAQKAAFKQCKATALSQITGASAQN